MTDSLGIAGFLAGVASGATKLVVGHPFDTIKVRLQTEGLNGRFKSPLQCLITTVRKEGFRALYKGATPPLFGWVIMDAVHFGTLSNFRSMQQQLNPSQPLTIPQHALAGFGAGTCVAFLATPIELLKAKLQVQYDAQTKRYTGPIDCARHIIRRNGVLGLWRSLPENLLFRSNFWIMWGILLSFSLFMYCTIMTCFFLLRNWYTRMLPKWHVPQVLVPFVAGGLAANTFWTIIYPADVVRNRLMTYQELHNSERPGIIACTRQIYQKEGIKAFYRGFVTAQLRSFPANGAALVAFQACMRAMSSPLPQS